METVINFAPLRERRVRTGDSVTLNVSGGPDISLACGRVHECLGDAADSFAVVLAARTRGAVIWIGRGRDVGSLAPMALTGFFDPARLILTECASRSEILWATEQALRAGGAGLVVSQMGLGPNLRESRRLQLAAEQGGALGLVLIGRRAQSSAAQTRWHCTAQMTLGDPVPGKGKGQGAAPWIWELTKNKSGPVGRWAAHWRQMKGESDAPGHVHLVAAIAA